ncbi:Hypothetical_protein [Hexamita inflata]|uniref:Hypothetical_protein n=1 Tax=Hexamita inflata TaxID=28002 RepID=A0ABP1GKX8_9EUKA
MELYTSNNCFYEAFVSKIVQIADNELYLAVTDQISNILSFDDQIFQSILSNLVQIQLYKFQTLVLISYLYLINDEFMLLKEVFIDEKPFVIIVDKSIITE